VASPPLQVIRGLFLVRIGATRTAWPATEHDDRDNDERRDRKREKVSDTYAPNATRSAPGPLAISRAVDEKREPLRALDTPAVATWLKHALLRDAHRDLRACITRRNEERPDVGAAWTLLV
jgi:hypothetical protein